jgi:hypothetical protein
MPRRGKVVRGTNGRGQPAKRFAKMAFMGRSWTLLLALILASSVVFANHPDTMVLLEPVQPEEGQPPAGTEWKRVASDSSRFLSFQHVYRIAFQAKTRRFLGGPFFGDYGSSIKGLGGWKDGDNTYTNYVLHPIQGAVSGFVFLYDDPGNDRLEFGKSGSYWLSRLKAFGFAALYSTQFELGPLSEASIGNVGKTKGTMGFVDLVITPVGGFGWIVAEDAIDRFVIRHLEKKSRRKGLIRFLRVALNPARSFSNVMRLKLPWYRPGRELNRLFPEPKDELMDEFYLAGPQGGEGGGPSPEFAVLLIFVPA